MSVTQEKKKLPKAILIGILSSGVIMLLLTCLFCLMLKMTSGLPYGIIDYVMIGIEGVGVLIGAYIACRVSKCKGLNIGAAVGVLTLMILLCVGFALPDNHIGLLTLIRSAVLLLCGVIGGIAGVNKKEKVRIK